MDVLIKQGVELHSTRLEIFFHIGPVRQKIFPNLHKICFLGLKLFLLGFKSVLFSSGPKGVTDLCFYIVEFSSCFPSPSPSPPLNLQAHILTSRLKTHFMNKTPSFRRKFQPWASRLDLGLEDGICASKLMRGWGGVRRRRKRDKRKKFPCFKL